jgi:hypothetical protein
MAQGCLSDLAKQVNEKYKLCLTDDDRTQEMNVGVLRAVSQEIKDKSGDLLKTALKDPQLVTVLTKLNSHAGKILAQCDGRRNG